MRPVEGLDSARRWYGFREIEFTIIDIASLDQPTGECQDFDGDGYGRLGSSGCFSEDIDCKDADPSVHPGRDEIIGDWIDNDCNPRTDDNGCTWGERDCNRCVENVELQFSGFGSSGGEERIPPTGRFTYHSGAPTNLPGLDGELDPIDEQHGNHIQGFARIPGLRQSNIFVASRSNVGRRPAGLIFAEMNGISGEMGERLVPLGSDRDRYWISEPTPDNPPSSRGAISFVHIEETRHPGGIQLMGQIVAVPCWCDSDDCSYGNVFAPEDDPTCSRAPSCSRGYTYALPPSACGLPQSLCAARYAFVDFYDSSVCINDPLHENCHVNRKYLTRDELHFDKGRKAYYVAISEVPDGRYVMVVNRGDNGKADSYISSSTVIDSATEWVRRVRQWWREDFNNYDGTYQNMNFVTECTTRQVYLLGFAQDGFDSDSNNIDLFRVRIENESDVDINRVARARFLSEFGDTCEMKGGANVYVTPHGEMIVYCSQGRTRGNEDARFLDFSEHTSNINDTLFFP